MRGRPDRRAVAVAVLVLAVLLLAGIAARGPAVVSGSGAALPVPDEPFQFPEPALPTNDGQDDGTPQREPDEALPRSPVAGYVVMGLLALVAAGALGLLARSLWERRPTGGRRPPRLLPAAAASGPATESLARAAQEALIEVDQPAAREAVVRSWVLLGAAAAAAGLPARDTETATEYATRLQAEVGLPGRQLRRLAGLYHEARFSAHDVGEGQRGEARQLLGELLEDLSRDRTGARP